MSPLFAQGSKGLLWLFLLFSTVWMPLQFLLVEYDATRYWLEDVNALLEVRAALNTLGICAALFSLTHLVVPNRFARLEEVKFYGLVFVMMVALVAGLFIVPVGLAAIVFAFLGEPEHLGHAVWLAWPLGAGLLFLRAGVKHPDPPQVRVPVFLSVMAAPFVLAAVGQYSAWFLEKHCWQAIRGGGPGYLEEVARYRPVTWLMNEDPMIMRYLRATDHLKAGPVPETIPPGEDALANRMVAAYRVLTDEDLELAALERYETLVNHAGFFRDPGE